MAGAKPPIEKAHNCHGATGRERAQHDTIDEAYRGSTPPAPQAVCWCGSGCRGSRRLAGCHGDPGPAAFGRNLYVTATSTLAQR
jgi:hypothetical protein